MKYTYADVKNSMPKEKAARDALWVKLWVRPLSVPLSFVALNMGITPNTISVVSILDTILACVLMMSGNNTLAVIGLVVLNLFILWDCMDGAMARTMKRASYMGEFYDAAGGYTICAFSLLAGGVCAYYSGNVMLFTSVEALILMSALGSICDVFARLIYQKYTVSEIVANVKMNKPIERENDSFETEKPSFSLTYLRNEFDRQFGTGGFFPPILMLSYFLRVMDIVVILYSLYHILAYVAVMVIYCRRATNFDKNNRK